MLNSRIILIERDRLNTKLFKLNIKSFKLNNKNAKNKYLIIQTK